MRTYRGGEQVGPGIYCCLATGELFQSPGGEERLPGEADRRYIRTPALLVMVGAPLVGLGFVVFLPVVGIAGLLMYVGNRVARVLSRAAREVAPVAVPSWVPGVSYLVRGQQGRKRPRKAREEWPQDMETFLGDLEEELRERRQKGEQ